MIEAIENGDVLAVEKARPGSWEVANACLIKKMNTREHVNGLFQSTYLNLLQHRTLLLCYSPLQNLLEALQVTTMKIRFPMYILAEGWHGRLQKFVANLNANKNNVCGKTIAMGYS